MSTTTPVTIVSGSLGAGKTTLLNHLLSHTDRRLAILVNDMGEVNIDAALLESSVSREGIAELSNGCICCELQDDLETEVRALASRYDFDHLVVEASGISEPAPVARLFTVGRAAARYEVDALVTVVDGPLLAETFAGETVERETPVDAEDRPLADLLIEQIEVSNICLLNKCDQLPDDDIERLEAIISALQPDATVIRTIYSEIEPRELLGRELFDPGSLAELPGWQRALEAARAHEGHHGEHSHDHSHDHGHDHDHTHRTPESVYGVESITYRRRQPFDPKAFAGFLEDLPASVVRLKGPCWIAGRDDLVIQISGAGRSITAEATSPWVVTLPPAQQSLYRDNHPDLPWDDTHGDRRTELVFIGTDLEHETLEAKLDSCLTETDGTQVVSTDPFPETVDERTVIR